MSATFTVDELFNFLKQARRQDLGDEPITVVTIEGTKPEEYELHHPLVELRVRHGVDDTEVALVLGPGEYHRPPKEEG